MIRRKTNHKERKEHIIEKNKNEIFGLKQTLNWSIESEPVAFIFRFLFVLSAFFVVNPFRIR